MEFSLHGANSGNLINQWIMNSDQFKDPVSHMCLAGTVIASWSVAQEVAGSIPFNDKYLFYWIHLGKTILDLHSRKNESS